MSVWRLTLSSLSSVLLHPYVISSTEPLLDFMAEQDIAIEGYSSLIPLTARPGGPVDIPVTAIATRLGVAAEQVLLAWARAKGSIIITTSSRKDRLERYLAVGDIHLTDADIEAIDKAGKLAESRSRMWAKVAMAGKIVGVGAMAGYLASKYLC